LPERRRGDVVLATHEALATAIEHSASVRSILVRVEADKDEFTIEVSDDGVWKTARTSEELGRGLGMIRSLVSETQITTDKRGATVRQRLERA
jgi:anti-sigma regulatory factor (Ser/Thr protein kinase)